MCIRTSLPETEREKLEEALRRTERVDRDWCDAGKVVLAAARKHLDTLPKPPRKVKATRWLVVTESSERGPYLDRADACALMANAREPFAIVELTGEYEWPRP